MFTATYISRNKKTEENIKKKKIEKEGYLLTINLNKKNKLFNCIFKI